MPNDNPLELIKATIGGCLGQDAVQAEARARFEAIVPAAQRTKLEAVLGSSNQSYRDAALIQLAYGLCAQHKLNLTQRPEGARGVAGKLGRFFAENHIGGVKDAYQNIGKNTRDLARGNFPEFDTFLKWASAKSTSRPHLQAAFDFSCAFIAATARPVDPCPDVDGAKLTFGATIAALEGLYATKSQGAFHQFTIAALLHGLVEQTGTPGYRVTTKSLNSSDKSSRTAGDVQIMSGNQIVEAYEVTANLWTEKMAGASQTIREHDLSRIHIVARIDKSGHADLIEALQGIREDVSVLDVHEFTASLVSALRRNYRKAALERLYELLDRLQPDVQRVNQYVAVLKSHGLTRPSGAS